MSASLTTVRTQVRKDIAAIETRLVAAEEATGSLQCLFGIALAPLKDVAGKDFKSEVGKVSKRPYGTLNRWANVGRTALALGFSLTSKDVPPVYRIEPGFRFIRDARTPEAFAEGVADLKKWWNANSGKDAAAAEKAADRMKPKPESSGNGSNGSGSGSNGSGDASETVTIDPAAVSVIAGDLKRMNNRKVYQGVDHATLNACRIETALYLREHPNFNEFLAALSN